MARAVFEIGPLDRAVGLALVIPQLWIKLVYHIAFKRYSELAPCARRGEGGHMLKSFAFQGYKGLPVFNYS